MQGGRFPQNEVPPIRLSLGCLEIFSKTEGRYVRPFFLCTRFAISLC